MYVLTYCLILVSQHKLFFSTFLSTKADLSHTRSEKVSFDCHSLSVQV